MVLVNSEAKWCFPKSELSFLPSAASPPQQATNTLTLFQVDREPGDLFSKYRIVRVTVAGEVKSPVHCYNWKKNIPALAEVLGKVGGPNTTRMHASWKLFAKTTEKEYTLDLTRLSTIQRENIWLQSGRYHLSPPSNVNHCKRKPVPLLSRLILSSLAVFLTLVK